MYYSRTRFYQVAYELACNVKWTDRFSLWSVLLKKKEVEIRSPTDICEMCRSFKIVCLHTGNISRARSPVTHLLWVTDAQLIKVWCMTFFWRSTREIPRFPRDARFYYGVWTQLNLRTSLFWAVTQRVMVIPYRRFGTTCRSHFHGPGI